MGTILPLFLVYSFLWWLCEVIYVAVSRGRLVNRGFLSGPFCPVGGAGLTAMTLLIPEGYGLFTTFALALALGMCTEFGTALVFRKSTGLRLRDYFAEPFNLMGYVSLKSALLWGLAGLFVLKTVNPILIGFIGTWAGAVSTLISAALLLIMAADFTNSLINILALKRAGICRNFYQRRLADAFPHMTEGETRRVLDAGDECAPPRRRPPWIEYLMNHKHLFYILFAPAYFLSYFWVEAVVPTTGYWLCYTPLDDIIPFCEYFYIFYFLWYFQLVAVGLFLLFKDLDGFRKYVWYMMVTTGICLMIFLLFPTGQELRPAEFPRDNIFTRLVENLYKGDTNTNVFPSGHAVGAIVAAAAFCRTTAIKRRWPKIIMCVLAVLIILSTVFIKQHSVLDVFGAIPVCLPFYFVFYPVKKRRTPTLV